MKHITLKQIKAHNPCREEYVKVRRFFGKRKRIAVTVKAAVAVAGQFNFDWLAEHLLTPAARAEYERATAAAWAEFKRATAPAWAEYDRARAAALAEFERVTAAAFARAYLNMK